MWHNVSCPVVRQDSRVQTKPFPLTVNRPIPHHPETGYSDSDPRFKKKATGNGRILLQRYAAPELPNIDAQTSPQSLTSAKSREATQSHVDLGPVVFPQVWFDTIVLDESDYIMNALRHEIEQVFLLFPAEAF